MRPGTVFYIKKFKFDDGDEAHKLFVLMTHARNKRFLVVRTTSQKKKWRSQKQGCHAERGYYYFQPKSSWFAEPTWIILDDPHLLQADVLRARFQNGSAVIKTTLDTPTTAALRNCLKRVDDISDEMLTMLS